MNFDQISPQLQSFLRSSLKKVQDKASLSPINIKNILNSPIDLNSENEVSFDQPYTMIQKASLNSKSFIIRASILVVFFAILDILFLCLYFCKNRQQFSISDSSHQGKFDSVMYADLNSEH
ncbi:hypothetical protein M9Y10_002247 [Tritrichomonas musculus]|uniref:Uncharacterized protein n=1 Tax=Tritrichomonas musculus TaxID=1915356 RepID=A0ABR2L992_9EUKA